MNKWIIEAGITCKRKAQFLLSGKAGTKHEYETLLDDLREEYRPKAIAALLAHCKLTSAAPVGQITTATLKTGCPLLLNCVADQELIQFPFDALVRVKGDSLLGAFHYAPVCFLHEEMVLDQHRLMLGVAGITVAHLQGRRPDNGILVAGRTCRVTHTRISSRLQRAQELLDKLAGMVGQETAIPVRLIRHCEVCEFREICTAEAEAQNHLSLLRGISDAEIEKLTAKGISTVKQLSYTFHPPRRSRDAEAAKKSARLFSLQALALREKRVFVLGSTALPHAPHHIYLDIEGDSEGHSPYLFGVRHVSADTTQDLSFWSASPDEMESTIARFLDAIGHIDECVVFHYGSYDIDCLKLARTAVNAQLIDGIVQRSCNVLSLVRSYLYFPTYSNSLKDIGSFLGHSWPHAVASGIQSLVWRRLWEKTHDPTYREGLITYNHEDCVALQRVTEFLYAALGDGNIPLGVAHDEPLQPDVAYANDVGRKSHWNRRSPMFPNFAEINKCAYFDYQREHVFVRHSKQIKKQQAKTHRKRKLQVRINRHIEMTTPECPECGGRQIERKARNRAKLVFNLTVSNSGIRKHVTKVTAPSHTCRKCGLVFLPPEYRRLDKHGHALKSWAMYQHIVHRMSMHRLVEMFRDVFGLPIHPSDLIDFKSLMAERYRVTYAEILGLLKAGGLIHSDETGLRLKTGKGNVWVFASLEEVYFMYRPTREGGFLADMLDGFQGVLVSDFYGAYDALPFAQQKCLVHFMRDLNSDLLKHPFDEELKAFVARFSSLMQAIVATIDKHGLKKCHLHKHRKEVDAFLRETASGTCGSSTMETYRKRLCRYGTRMFTFLDRDGVPWNNANAEHAIRRFAYYRAVAEGLMTQTGAEQYLTLLSVFQTCVYKGIDFLQFLLSQETSIVAYLAKGRHKTPPPALVMYPDNFLPLGTNRSGMPSLASQRNQIVELKKAGKSVSEIAEEVGVSKQTVIRTLSRLYYGGNENRST